MLFLLDALSGLLNRLFARPIDALLALLHIHPANPAIPISNALTLELVVATGLIAFFALVRAGLSVEKPGSAQLLAEMTSGFVDDQAHSVIGHGHEKYLPFLTMILVFILSCNLFGLLPGIETPTASPVVPLGIAILTFVYYHVRGVAAQSGSLREILLGAGALDLTLDAPD